MILEGLTGEVVNGGAFCQTLNEFLEKKKSIYEDQLIPDLSYINNRAECVTGIEIECIEHHFSNEYTLNYKFDWTVYNGCANMDEMDTIETHIFFTVEIDGTIHFELSQLERRSTAGEL